MSHSASDQIESTGLRSDTNCHTHSDLYSTHHEQLLSFNSDAMPHLSAVRHSQRQPQYTEKGRLYKVEVLSKNFWTRHSDLSTTLTEANTLLQTSDANDVQSLKQNIRSQLASINDIFEQLHQLDCEENLETAMDEINTKAVIIINKIVELSTLSPAKSRCSAKSIVSKAASSARTSSSQRSSLSTKKVTAAAEAAALRAQLQAQIEQSQQEAEIEEADRRTSSLRRTLELRKLETQLKMEEARLKVYEEEENDKHNTANAKDQSPHITVNPMQSHPEQSLALHLDKENLMQHTELKTHVLTDVKPLYSQSYSNVPLHANTTDNLLQHTKVKFPHTQSHSHMPPYGNTLLSSSHVHVPSHSQRLLPDAFTFQPKAQMSSDQQQLDPFTSEIELGHDHTNFLTPQTQPPLSSYSQLVSHAPSVAPSAAHSTESLVETIAQAMALSRLPIPEPPIFSGDPLQYPDWKSSFTALIDTKGIPAADKIHYLKRYLSGPAKEAVSGFFLLRSEEAYHHATAVLEKRFGNQFAISESFRRKLNDWPRVPSKDKVALQAFADFLTQCNAAVSEIGSLKGVNDIAEIQKISQKLPDWAAQRWNRIVATSRRDHSRYPSFSDFVKFVVSEADIANDPVFGVSLNLPPLVTRPHGRGHPVEQRTFTTETKSLECKFCKRKNHDLSDCRNFAKQDMNIRREYVKREKLCFGCLKSGHVSKACKQRSVCSTCEKKHPTSLHDENFKLSGGNQPTEVKQSATKPDTTINCKVSSNCRKEALTSMILPVRLSSKSNPNKELLVYALFDTMSDSTFVTEDVAKELQAPCHSVKLRLTTLTSSGAVVESKKYSDLQVRGLTSDVHVSLPESFSRHDIPVDEAHIPTPDTARHWPHLHRVQNLIAPKQDCPVGLLIGYNCPQALAPLQCIMGEPQQPFALETRLGWSIVGGSPSEVKSFDSFGQSHYTITEDCGSMGSVARVYKSQVTEITTGELLHLMERDFADNDAGKMSQTDLRFLQVLSENTRQRSDGFYEMPLPFKDGCPKLPNNRQAALHRALALKKQFLKKPRYQEHYSSFMQDIIDRGEAEKIPQDELHSDGSHWYIPHHGVYHHRKPDKVRVVFDCSARYEGTSLNDYLLQGPDLINPLVGVLCRFREGRVAFTCDIQRMYHQFRVQKQHQDYLRFLWWEGGDFSKPPIDYRMKVHLFGATSSPGCANFGLKRIASDHRHLGEKAADFLHRNFYVDDGLKAENSATEAIEVLSNARTICEKANLKLHKVTSNSTEVMQSILDSERAVPPQINVDLDSNTESIESTLGLQWCTQDDTFRFKLSLENKPQTRRGILATVASVYDPLGLIAPIVLVGRQILQGLCKQNLGWDQSIPEDVRLGWEAWIDDLKKLENIQIPRCYFPATFDKPIKAELHHFSDASTFGYGQCSYLRLENATGEVHCSLVMAKARVTPLKLTTIPRLELQAATLSVKTAKLLAQELEYPMMTHHFWTDSKIVLGYVKNESKRFHMYVANRVQQIRENSVPENWNYVATNENPADHASRGLSVDEIPASNWYTGPTFLWQRNIVKECIDCEISMQDPEVRTATVHTTHQHRFTSFEKRVSRFSSYKKALSAVTTIIKACLRKQNQNVTNLEARKMGEKALIRVIQKEAFKQTDAFKDLDPFMDEDNLLRVGGRLSKTSEMFEVKHPVILPRSSQLSRLIAVHLHEKTAHQGRGLTINEIRSRGYWILGCRRVVSSLIKRCVTCIKNRGTAKGQKMSDLPEERVEPSPPFTYCGLDCFGPFTVKEGRKEVKRYGLLFTCLAMRAIHIELLDDLTTDSFLNGLRCLIALRGKVRVIRCDQGTNFVGANNELKANFAKLDQKTIASKMMDLDCEFKFNTPSASHMGGVWERQIRTVRSVLAGILDQPTSSRLDTSSLRTLMYEVMAIVNSRPLSVDQLEKADEPLPLTPNHILTMKSGVIMPPPPGHFVREDLYLRKRWRKVQFLADLFWTRWKREYLHAQQKRNTWQQQQVNMSVDDIVLLQDDGACRTDWRIARVVEALPDDDGLVRKVQLLMATSALDSQGRPLEKRTVLERPVHKLITLLPSTCRRALSTAQ